MSSWPSQCRLELTAGLLPPGHYVTLALSFDAKKAYFAFADPGGADTFKLPGYVQTPAAGGAKYNTFHIFALDADGKYRPHT